ncbi:hypothetical protein [Streptomyces sp. HD]|uniref:hypothetical protein n=1 Tax=Streptomyces sp. HD TaxID=3020892 RepID=UPI00232BE944|nr:hypothetical protein [Streptomyces sp. HD]MDC0773623.1 hypothetical protein [Streptomyces sp. HD]
MAATAALVGAWCATAGAATSTAPNLSPTTTAVSLSAEFPSQSAGYNNARERTRTATAVAPNGTLRVAWPASDGIHVTPLTVADHDDCAGRSSQALSPAGPPLSTYCCDDHHRDENTRGRT